MSAMTLAPHTPAFAAPQGVRVRWDRVAGLLVAVVLGFWLLAGGLAQTSVAGETPPAAISVVVQPGDTVYELAQLHAPDGIDTLSYAAVITDHNDVDARAIRPGMVLLLPQQR